VTVAAKQKRARKPTRKPAHQAGQPTLVLHPSGVQQGMPIVVRGTGWGSCPVALTIDRKPAVIWRIAQGAPSPGGVRPAATGEFVATLSTMSLKAGRHELRAKSAHQTRPAAASVGLTILARPAIEPPVVTPGGRKPRRDRDEIQDSPYWRGLNFFQRRFGHLGFVPPGMRETQIAQIRDLRVEKTVARHSRAVDANAGRVQLESGGAWTGRR
jgi:hypothetical protein